MNEIAQALTTSTTEELVERLFAATIGTLEIASAHIGGRLGFYRALSDGGNASPAELAPAQAPQSATYVSGWSSRRWPGS